MRFIWQHMDGLRFPSASGFLPYRCHSRLGTLMSYMGRRWHARSSRDIGTYARGIIINAGRGGCYIRPLSLGLRLCIRPSSGARRLVEIDWRAKLRRVDGDRSVTVPMGKLYLPAAALVGASSPAVRDVDAASHCTSELTAPSHLGVITCRTWRRGMHDVS
jgi:hypothetical protein